jgi:hypothetical protein
MVEVVHFEKPPYIHPPFTCVHTDTQVKEGSSRTRRILYTFGFWGGGSPHTHTHTHKKGINKTSWNFFPYVCQRGGEMFFFLFYIFLEEEEEGGSFFFFFKISFSL